MTENRDALKRWLGHAFRIVCIVGTFVALWLFIRGINLHQFGESFRRAGLWPLAAAVLLNLASQCIKALKWKVMLAPRHRIRFRRLLKYELAAQAASSTTPGRAGELLRFWLLKQDAVPATTTAALIALKKLLEGVGLTILIVPAPWLISGLPAWCIALIFVFGGAMVVFLALLTIAARRADPSKPPNLLRSLVGGIAFLRDGKRLTAAVALGLVGEAADFGAAVLLLQSLGINRPVEAGALLLFMVDVSNLLPAAPGQLGTSEIGALTGLALLHVSHGPALAFALLFHAQQVLPQVVLGLPFELRFFAQRRSGGAADEPGEVIVADRHPAGEAS
jgi:glycosyltransferase 2 family protein